MKQRGFYPRSLVAFLMATGFLVAAVTGTVLFIVPKGSIANWTGWTLGGLDKDSWGAVHMATGTMFVVAGLLHVYFNWKPLKTYIVSKAARGLNRRSELATALALTGFLVIGAVEGWPPVSYLLELNDWARSDLWTATGTGTYRGQGGGTVVAPAPAPADDAHAEALARAAEGIDSALAEALAKAEPAPTRTPTPGVEEHTGSGEGLGRGGGSGFGRMTLPELAARYGLDYQEVAGKLAAAGIPYAESEPLRDIAARAGMTPGDLGALVRGAE